MPCAPARNNVSIPSYQGAEVRGPEALRASVSRTTIFIMPTLASVCSTGGRLQMVKISKRSIGKLNFHHFRRPPVLQTDASVGMIKIVVRETEARKASGPQTSAP